MTPTGKQIVVITGMSGSGKSTAIRALEDAGWFCIDSLPAPLLLKVTELGESRDQLAFVVDVREGQFLKDAPRVIEEARRAGHKVDVLFLDSSDEALTRRYSSNFWFAELSSLGFAAPEIYPTSPTNDEYMTAIARSPFGNYMAIGLQENNSGVNKLFGLMVQSFLNNIGVPGGNVIECTGCCRKRFDNRF